MDIDCVAIITICKGFVHLDRTFNCDAMAPIQIEDYDSEGWWMCQRCPALARAFWDVWSKWNGRTRGGIVLTDGMSEAEVRRILEALGPAYRPEEIGGLPDGMWLIESAAEPKPKG